MSKFAVVGLSKSIRLEAAEQGIQVNLLCPMAVETPILDSDLSHRLGTPWRADMRAYMTRLSGTPYPVDLFAEKAIDRVERNQALIVTPFSARLSVTISRLFPGVVEKQVRKIYREFLATRPEDSQGD